MLVVAACLALAGAAWGVSAQLKGPPPSIVQYGYVKSLKKQGVRWQLRFDPALWLSGETANRAAIEDGAIDPGDVVPNDYYIRNPDKKLLTYQVPSGASVTVVTNAGGRLRSTRISVAELAAIVKGKNPRGRKLMDPAGHLGYWARVRVDTTLALDQQYQP